MLLSLSVLLSIYQDPACTVRGVKVVSNGLSIQQQTKTYVHENIRAYAHKTGYIRTKLTKKQIGKEKSVGVLLNNF